MSEELPEGWYDSAITDICKLNPSKPAADEVPRDSKVTFVPMPAVDADSRAITNPQVRTFEEVRKGFTSFRDNDVILAKITPCFENGKAAVCRGLLQGLGFGSTEFHVLRSTGSVLPEYVYRFVQQDSFLRDGETNMTGSVGQKRVPVAWLGSMRIPLPPLPEQQRIVAQVEALLARVQAARARLAKVPALLKRFRQSVLAAACSGELTEDWREDNTCRETGGTLLTRIKSARFRRAESTKDRQQIESAFAESALEVTDEELGLEGIPESWSKCRIGGVATVCNGSTPSRKHPEFWDGAIPWVSSGEVRDNIVKTTREYITDQGYESSSVRLLPRGTVLLAMIGEGKTRGQSAILDIESTINQNIAAAVISHGLILPEFLWRWFQMRYEATREQGGGSGPQALNCQRVRELPFVVPPLAEQHEIARRVDALFALADKIEARVAAAASRVEKITQAILAKAFRGELVPTEAELARQEGRDYEPASVLLERVRAEREATASAPPKGPRRRTAKHT